MGLKNQHCFLLKSVSVIRKLKAAAFQNTLELYQNQLIKGRNFCLKLDNAVLLPLKMPFLLLFWTSSPFYHDKKKTIILNGLHHRKGMTKTIFLAYLWGVNIFRTRHYIFINVVATIWCPYLAGLLTIH